MKYQCDLGHQFIHPATRTTNESPTTYQDLRVSSSAASVPVVSVAVSVESSVCPFCYSLVFDEIPEPQVESIKSVDINEADQYLKDGYEIVDRYAKSVTVVKKKVQEK